LLSGWDVCNVDLLGAALSSNDAAIVNTSGICKIVSAGQTPVGVIIATCNAPEPGGKLGSGLQVCCRVRDHAHPPAQSLGLVAPRGAIIQADDARHPFTLYLVATPVSTAPRNGCAALMPRPSATRNSSTPTRAEPARVVDLLPGEAVDRSAGGAGAASLAVPATIHCASMHPLSRYGDVPPSREKTGIQPRLARKSP
jgi:hypothetical protein